VRQSESAAAAARTRKFRCISVTANDQALGFYERAGFVTECVVETRFGRHHACTSNSNPTVDAAQTITRLPTGRVDAGLPAISDAPGWLIRARISDIPGRCQIGQSVQVNADEYVEAAAARMDADGSEVSRIQLPVGPAVVGYRAQFKLKWFATKLHAFTVVVPVPAATLDVLTDATQQSLDYAKQTKGKLRGFQTGVAALPVLVSSEVSPDARATVESRPSKKFAAQTLPAIVDLSSGQIHRYEGRLVWGGIYDAWLRARLDALPHPGGADG
jgi:hypothetical protein